MNEANPGLELLEPASPEALLPGYGLWPWWLAAGALLVLLLVLWLVLGKRKVTANPLAVRMAAFNEAAAALSSVAAENARAAAVQCSLILRRYLSAAAGDPALFETHEEFISRRDSLQSLTPEARASTETGFSRLAALKYSPEIPHTDPAAIIAESRGLLETLNRGFAA
jgi:hypothetical protein